MHRKKKLRIAIAAFAVLFTAYAVFVYFLVSACLVPSFMDKLNAFEDITENVTVNRYRRRILRKTGRSFSPGRRNGWRKRSAKRYRCGRRTATCLQRRSFRRRRETQGVQAAKQVRAAQEAQKVRKAQAISGRFSCTVTRAGRRRCTSLPAGTTSRDTPCSYPI